MKKKLFFGFILTVVLTIAVTSAVIISAAEKPAKQEIYKQLELFSDALAIVEEAYVDNVEMKELVYGALKGMLSSLDPHSQFMDPDAFKELRVETEGQFGGLGIEITIKDNLLTVITPIEDTPAWKAGIKAGDRIVKIGDEPTRDIALTDAVKKMRGKPGTEVTLTILRESEGKLLNVTIVRDIIKIKDIKKARILEDGVAYVRIIEFRENTEKELRQALERLLKEGMSGLVLDLRYNPGGLLDAAANVTSLFLPKGTLIVSTQGRLAETKLEFKSKAVEPVLDIPMVVLINEGSASGSEILAGALQDHHRAIIMGKKSFGKGSVQTVIPMADGSALRLTTSKYFTPSGRSIHSIGIQPDVEVLEMALEDKDADDENVDEVFRNLERQENGVKEDVKEEDPEVKEEHDYKQDYQLLRAIDLLKAIKIFNNKN